jgi:hypothetical protein
MAEIHHLIIRSGVDEARRQAVTNHERMLVEAAYQVLSEDAEKIGFTVSDALAPLGNSSVSG